MNLLVIFTVLMAVLQFSAGTQNESFMGVLSGPENSGEEHQYLIDIEPGTLLTVNASFMSVEGVGARIYVAISAPSGGYYAYADDFLPSSSSKTITLSYHFGSSTSSGRIRVVVGSVADRYAPAVVEYVLETHRIMMLDAGAVEAGDNLEAPLLVDLSSWEPSSEAYELRINGYLSSGTAGNDYADYYLIRLPVRDDYAVRVEMMDGSSLVDAYLRLRDGYAVSSMRSGSMTAALRSADEFLISVETADASSSVIGYNLTVRVSRLAVREDKAPELYIIIAALLGLAVAVALTRIAGRK